MFNTIESSTQNANGVDLYYFSCGPNKWYWCAGEIEQTWRGKVYEPLAISNNGIRQDSDASNNETVITLPSETELAQMIFADPPSIPVRMIMRRRHFGSDDAPINMIAELTNFGRAANPLLATLTFKMLTASYKQSGARMAWAEQCQHALYDKNCRVKPQDYSETIEITGIKGNRIRSPDLKHIRDGKLSNGYIEWVNDWGITQRRSIETNGNDRMTLFGKLTGLSIGMVVTAYPGCARTTKVCENTFNNLANYGGAPFLSGKSPFQGDPIW